LRIARGDSGAVEAGVSSALDLYPYGTPFAASAAESRRQFTGHERDEATGQDYMLARYYGANLGRFLSTDPAGAGVEVVDPQSWNAYTYVGNNPLKFIDPDGEVKFATTDAETKYNEAKAYLTTSKEGQKLISSLESLSGSSEPTLVLNSNDDDSFDPSTNTINWDPNSGLDVAGEGGKADSSGGTVQTPALGLAHEADHAVHGNTAPKTQAKDAAKADAKYGNKEEKRVIKGSEKKLAKQLDEPTRKSHGGKPVKTKGPKDEQPPTP
jgi:RHS repeat-associated protein